MKQEKQNEKAAEYDNFNNEEEQLNMDELMDVQGGQENPKKSCGLGCYLSGINNTEHEKLNYDRNNKP